MKMQQVSDNCYAVLNETSLVCDANSGLVNIGPGVIIDTQSDLPHARQMVELFSSVWSGTPAYVALTHEDIDHVAGNQMFPHAEIIAHRAAAERMATVADPSESDKLTHSIHHFLPRMVLHAAHPGVLAVARQLDANYDFDGIEVVLPSRVFDDRHVVDLDGTEVHLLHFGAAHQEGDATVHVPSEGVLFAGDLLFNESTPMGWVGPTRPSPTRSTASSSSTRRRSSRGMAPSAGSRPSRRSRPTSPASSSSPGGSSTKA